VSEEAKAALKERDRLWNQTQKLRAAGKLSEAISAAEAMLAIERKVLPENHADLAVSLNWLAALHKAAALKERDRLWGETQKLRAGGKTAEAIAAAEAMLAIERKVLPENHADLAGSLGWLAALHVEREDFAAAKAARHEALDILRKGRGESEWRVVDARQALAGAERLAEMDRDQRARLAEAERLNRAIVDLNRAGKYAEAVPLARQALAIRQAVLGERHPDTAESLNKLAELLEAQGNYAAAKPLYEQALAIRQAALGERHPDTATSLNNLALLLKAQGDYAAAKPLLEQALSIYKAVLGERHPDTATCLNNLAELLEAQGNYAAAKSLHEQALAITKAVLGERHPHTATCLNNLALLLKAQGDYAAAKPLFEQALAIRKEVLGERHPDTATSLNNLALLLKAQGNYAAAKPLYERALAIRKAVLGERHPDTATSLNNLAALHWAQGDYAAARPLLEQALAIRKAVLGERHPDTATSLNNLAELLEAQGDYAAAKPLYEQALAIEKAVLGERHPGYATDLDNLAGLLEAQGDYAAARPRYEQALAIRKAVLGERHPDTATSLNNLAGLLEAQGDYAAARPLYEQALAIRKAVLGERHPDTATSLNNLALLLKSQGDYAAAKPLLEQALGIRKAVLGERHSDTATSLNNLAFLLHAQGDYAAAKPLFEQALAIDKEALGEKHPGYATHLNNLALLLQAQGDYAAARPLLEQALAIRKEVLGERHLDYATSLSSLAALHWAQGDYAAAAPLLKQALEIAQGNLDLAAAAQSERQQLAMAQQLRGRLDAYLSLAPLAKLSPGDAYRHVLTAKGSVFEKQRRLRVQRRRLQADPQSEAAQRFTDYQQTVKQLATLALGMPDPKQAQTWRTKIADLARRTDELEAELARLDAGFRAERAEASRTPEQFQAALPRGTALVDLLVYTACQPPTQGKGKFQFEPRLLAFVVRRDRPIARVDLGPIAPILKAIDEWRPILVGGKTAAAASDPAQTLRRLIWAPVESHLEGIASVLVSPDGALGLVPLAALPGKEPSRYLIEERSIAVVPVPRMLGSTATVSPAPGQGTGPAQAELAPSLLLVGDIDYGGDPGKGDAVAMSRSAAIGTRAGALPDFPHLDATREEILAVRDSFERRFRKARADVLREDEATEAAFRREAPGHPYLHLATHGYFAPKELRSALGPDDPKGARPGIDTLGGAGVTGYHPGLLSGIAFAGANRRPTPIGEDDGILTAMEVAELDLSGVELAVLSACETGLGEVAGGEGLLGLQRAFQVAGAQSVVASLWTIGDEPTRALMSRFYENLWRKGQPPAQALREAQLSMLRGSLWRGTLKRETDGPKSDRLPPLYWAAFVLSTDRP